MSKSTTAIARPKVRFSEVSDNPQNKEDTNERYKEKVIQQTSGPRIKSIMSLKKPVRIVDPKKSNADSKITSESNCATKILPHSSNTVSESTRSAQSYKNVPKVESVKILYNNTTNIQGNDGISQIDKNDQGKVLMDYKSNVEQKGKENKGSKHQKMTKSRSVPNIKSSYKVPRTRSFSSSTKSSTSSVTPCYKTVTRNRISPAKKMVLRDVSSSKVRTSVGPGIYHPKKGNNTKMMQKKDDTNKRYIIGSDAEELAQPKYNSIMCTIDKLKEYQQQRIVTDINHLPSAQKNIINGKISTALDFPLDEILYKNLVDLSIAEEQLPSTITRSKDPKPRQKDDVLNLADFFTPEDTNEVYEVVQSKPRMPKLVENWNAFKICDMIHEWKHRLDDI
ncbi:uncharacterized protein LOC109853130 [Pseudomyrmex gracilis]|uniref:uncharacterized protein LOC109853130 n=1 Tax=Pseudomyrmex gracilis TaxID=219809 RepID=UPI000994C252|nr:uncharacterized protein LOC109853130 [Pseudomyrmex gracilis]